MKYIIEPTSPRVIIHITKKGLCYKAVTVNFLEDGELNYKDVYSTHFPHRMRRYILDVLYDIAFHGIKAREVEIYNFTGLSVKLGAVKVHNI